MVQGAGTFNDGWNNKANHDKLEEQARTSIVRAADAKVPNVITLFGARRGMSDQEGIDNCITGLNRVKKFAEDHGVTLCVELLNSKVDHKDYQGDHTSFGVAVVKAVDSPRVKLLYDAYHMQIMEGDLIRTIRDNIQYIAHFHVGRCSRPPRDRRHAGSAVANGGEGDRGSEFSRVHRARVRPHARSSDIAQASRRTPNGLVTCGARTPACPIPTRVNARPT